MSNNDQLIKELEKHPKGSNILVTVELSSGTRVEIMATTVAYKPATGQIIIGAKA